MTTPDSAREQLRLFIRRYGPPAGEGGPERFVREQLHADPDEWQSLALADYGRGERQISIESCHGPGKTAFLAWCIIHQLVTRFPQKTAVTAPAKGQMWDALFPEVRKWMRQLPEQIQDLFEIKGGGGQGARIELKEADEDSFASFKTARPEAPDALQGVHSSWVLLIVDEADGVHSAIFESAIGSMSGHNATTILTGNPVRTSGFFFNANHGEGAARWKRYHISAIEGDHCGDNSFVSGRISEDFVEMVANEFGRESNAFRVRVLGRPPRSEADTIIPYEWIETAAMRDVTPNPLAPVVWGVDPGLADLTALSKRRQNVQMEPTRTWPGLNDTMEIVGVVKHEWDITAVQDRPVAINVDAIGLGAGVADRLRELGLPAVSINVSENPALNHQRYKNVRTELYFLARDWFARMDCYVPPDPELRKELGAQKYKIMESSGKVLALPKKDMMKFIHPQRSPDRGDSWILTFATDTATAAGFKSNIGWAKKLRRRIGGVV